MNCAIQKRVIVGIGEIKASADPSEILLTFALGSCVGVTAYDPNRRVGGVIHVMLPHSTADLEKARKNPYMFMDSGMEELLNSVKTLGADLRHLEISAAGGASFAMGETTFDFFEIGKRNIVTLRKILWKYGLLLQHEDLGGNSPRNLSLAIGTGEVRIWSRGGVK